MPQQPTLALGSNSRDLVNQRAQVLLALEGALELDGKTVGLVPDVLEKVEDD